MDAHQFDQLSRSLSRRTAAGRRTLLQGLGAAAAASAAGLFASEAEARRTRRNAGGAGVSAEHWKHKKVKYCINGKTVKRFRRQQDTLLAQGATRGPCSTCTPTTCAALGVICGPASDGCGGTLQCGGCDLDLSCCTGQCVNLQDDDANCGTCGNVCVPPATCGDGRCSIA
ncbi:MAG: hypothetical protein QM692_13405 [Thermomicrobiales bacterium]